MKITVFKGALEQALPAAPAPQLSTLASDLAKRYAEPARHWHTATHIEDMLRRAFAANPNPSPALLLAILFHDAVYIPGAKDNEARSADLARESLTSLATDAVLAETVAELVLATAQHETSTDHDTAILHDLDLAVLASSPEIYDDYAVDVRREYAHIDDATWARGRSEFLKAMLNRPHLYAALPEAPAMDRDARANLVRELACLRNTKSAARDGGAT